MVLAASFKATYFIEQVDTHSEKDESQKDEDDDEEDEYDREPLECERKIKTKASVPTEEEKCTHKEQQLLFDMLHLDAQSMVRSVNTRHTRVDLINVEYEILVSSKCQISCSRTRKLNTC